MENLETSMDSYKIINKVLKEIDLNTVKGKLLEKLLDFLTEIKTNFGLNVIYHRNLKVEDVYETIIKEGYVLLTKDSYLDKYVYDEFVKVMGELFPSKLTIDGTTLEEFFAYIKTIPNYFESTFLTERDFIALKTQGKIKNYVIYDENGSIVERININTYLRTKTVVFEIEK